MAGMVRGHHAAPRASAVDPAAAGSGSHAAAAAAATVTVDGRGGAAALGVPASGATARLIAQSVSMPSASVSGASLRCRRWLLWLLVGLIPALLALSFTGL